MRRISLRSSRFIIVLFCFALLAAKSGIAESNRAIGWQDPTQVKTIVVGATEQLDIRLKDLLAATGSGNLRFGEVNFPGANKLPSWVVKTFEGNLDSLSLTGTAPAREATTVNIFLNVKDLSPPPGDTDDGGIKKFTLRVVPIVKWINLADGVINFGKHPERVAFSHNLLQKNIQVIGDGFEGTATTVTITSDNINTVAPWQTPFNSPVVDGTPQRGDVGQYSGINFLAVTDENFSASVQAKGEVTLDLICPQWTAETFNLAEASEEVLYEQDVSVESFITNPEAATLSFSITKPAPSNWITIQSDSGVLSGTPDKREGGKTDTIEVEFSTSLGAKVCTDRATFDIKILDNIPNEPPLWSETPIELGNKLLPGQAIDFSICDKVSDPDDGPGPLTVAKTGGQAGIELNGDCTNGQGSLQGNVPTTPGPFTINLLASDTEDTTPNTATGTVVKDDPPLCENQPWQLSAVAGTPSQVNINNSNFVTEPEGETISFELVTTNKPFVTVSTEGLVSFNAGAGDEGAHPGLVVRVTDSADPDAKSSDCQLNVTIEKGDTNPPICQNQPWSFTATAGTLREENLDTDAFVIDPDNETLSFELTNPKDFVTISPDGKLQINAQESDVGPHLDFIVKVTDAANPNALSADCKMNIEINAADKPPVCQNQPWSFTATAGTPRPENLNTDAFVIDPESEALSFELVNPKNFVSISATGQLQINAGDDDVGPHPGFIVRVTDAADPQALSVDCTMDIEINAADKAPVCQNVPWPFTVTAGTELEEDLNSDDFVIDPEGETLAFELINPQDFVTVSPEGLLSINAGDGEAGNQFDFVVRVTDEANPLALSADCDMKIDVIAAPVDNPPQCKNEPWTFSVVEGETLEAGLNSPQFVFEPDGESLKFTQAVPAASFVNISEDGVLTLTPSSSDVKEHNFDVTITDEANPDAVSATCKMKVYVKPADGNEAPQCLNEPWQIVAIEDKPEDFNLNTPDFVFDPDGDEINFLLLNPPDFLALASDGILSANAKLKDVGSHQFNVQISDPDGLTDSCKLYVEVKRKPDIPYIEDPYYKACIDEYFEEDLKDYVGDSDPTNLQFRKISDPFGPLDRWLTVNSNGILEGIPRSNHIGQNEYTIEVRNEVTGAQYPVHIYVKNCDGGGDGDEYPIDPPKPGAYSDNLWIIESHISCPPPCPTPCPPNPCPPYPMPGPCRDEGASICYADSDGTEIGSGGPFETAWMRDPEFPVNTFAYQFYLGLKDYYEILKAADIHHHDAWMSTDTQYDGKLLKPTSGSLISTFEEGAQWVLNMGDRLRFYSDDSSNNPIRSMGLLYEQAPNLSVWQRDFWRRGVPMDAMVVTSSDTESGALGNYPKNYIDLHRQNDQNYRASAITSDCRYPGHSFSKIRRLVDATSPNDPGNQFWNDGCKIETRRHMSDYAHRVVFRARVVNQKRLPLQAEPKDPNQITVTIAGDNIPFDKWTYEANPPTVVMQWSDIDISPYRPGDKIVIKYPTLDSDNEPDRQLRAPIIYGPAKDTMQYGPAF